MSNKGLVILLLLLALILGLLSSQKEALLSSLSRGGEISEYEQAKQKALDFIKANLVQAGTEVNIKEISKDKGLYKLVIEIPGQEIISYITYDLSIFFPTALNIEEIETMRQQQTSELPKQEFPKTDTPEVKLFTQSFCPFGNQAENLIKPVVEALGEDVEIEPHYVLYENYQGGGPKYCLDKENKFCSMHGIDELKQDIRELCIYQDQKDKYWNFVTQVNFDCTVENVEECWEEAAEKVGVKISLTKDCQTSQDENFSAKELALNKELDVSASPTLIINGVKYQGARTPEAYKNAICSAFNNPPESCKNVLSSESSATSGDCGP
jgi:glutaredoxin